MLTDSLPLDVAYLKAVASNSKRLCEIGQIRCANFHVIDGNHHLSFLKDAPNFVKYWVCSAAEDILRTRFAHSDGLLRALCLSKLRTKVQYVNGSPSKHSICGRGGG